MTTSVAEFTPLAPGYNRDPYPLYERLRRESPVLHLPQHGLWMIFRYADNRAVMLDTDRFSSTIVRDFITGPYDPVPETEGALMESVDPPDHTRLRRLISPSFTPKALEALRPKVERIVDEAIARMRGMDEFDFNAELARGLPIDTFFTMAGVPRELHGRAKVWSNAVNESARYAGGGEKPGAETDERLRKVVAEYAEFLKDFVAARKSDPRDDVASRWVQDISVDNPLWEIEARKMLHLLVSAGSETTEKLLGNMLIAFADHPEQYGKVVENPSLIPHAVKEVLRYDGSALHMARISTEEVELSGTLVPKGSVVVLCFASANHDPERFDDPEVFDVTRDPVHVLSQHIGFGYGIHRCVGAHLATLQAEIVLAKVIEAFPEGLSYDPAEVERDDVIFVRGPLRLVMSPKRAGTGRAVRI